MTEAYSNTHMSNNAGFLSDSMMKLRLDTTKLLADMEAFYRGCRVVGFEERDNQILPKFEKLGEPRMNEKGIQDMLSWLASMFNPQTVQGNKKDDEFGEFMAMLQSDLAEDLMINMHEYEIKEHDFNTIIDKTISAADMFFSRTIDNLERASYAETMRSVERVGENRGGFASLNPFNK